MWLCKLISKVLPKSESYQAINIWQSKQSNKTETERQNILLEILEILCLSVLVSFELVLMGAASKVFFPLLGPPPLPPKWIVIFWCRRFCHLEWFMFVILEYLWIPRYINANSHKLHVSLGSCGCEWVFVKHLKVLLLFFFAVKALILPREIKCLMFILGVLHGMSSCVRYFGNLLWQLCCFSGT